FREPSVLALSTTLVSVPGVPRPTLAGRAQDPQRDGGQALGIELLRFAALHAPESKPVRGIPIAPRGVSGAGCRLRMEPVSCARHRTRGLDDGGAPVDRVSRRALRGRRDRWLSLRSGRDAAGLRLRPMAGEAPGTY